MILAAWSILVAASAGALAQPCDPEETKITASDATAGDAFGHSVAVSGNTAIVGAVLDSDAGPAFGSAYLFDVTTGAQLHKLVADPATAGYFGGAVAIDGNTAIVGAVGDSDGGPGSGAVYVFDVTTGAQLHKLTASDAVREGTFGLSLALSGNTAIVGAVNLNSPLDTGSAYVFDVTTGAQLRKLTASDAAAGARFGISVAISGNTAIVGAEFGSDMGIRSGSAYVFDVTTGAQLHKLVPIDPAASHFFGSAVALSGGTAVVSAVGDDDGGSFSGSAYLFDVATGAQRHKLTASDAAAFDFFGGDVAINGDTAIVGARDSDDAGDLSGSAYLFHLSCVVEAVVDIKPGDCLNTFNRVSRGVLPVAVLGTPDFDVRNIDVSTVRLMRADVLVAELLLHDQSPGAIVEVVVTGTLQDGTAFAGSDRIRLVPKGGPR